MRARGFERHHAARSAAFSLVELMIALIIIGIMAMTVAPSLQQVLGRRAPGAAIDTAAAHMLWFQESEPAGSNLGRIALYAGMNSKCQQTPWAQATGMAGQPLAVFDMTDFNPTNGTTQPRSNDAGRQVITLRATMAAARTDLRICFQPNGDVYTTAADNTTQLITQRDRVLFAIARTIDGVSYGRTRTVLFPAAGSMRFE